MAVLSRAVRGKKIASGKNLILIVVGQLGLGGTERHLAQVVPELVQKGFELKIYTLSPGGEIAEELSTRGIELLGKNFAGPRILKLPLVSFHLAMTWWKLRPAIVHYFLPEAYLLGGAISFISPHAKLLMSRRSLNYYQKKWPSSRFFERLLHRKMRKILANSKAVHQQLVTEGVASSKLRLIYNGVAVAADSGRERASFRDDIRVPERSALIVVIANLIPYKGHLDLLKALALLRETYQCSSWHLLVVGRDSGIQISLEEFAEQAEIHKHITWFGPSRDVIRVLNAADIAVLPSHEEGLSNFVLEAMAAGLPSVVTNVGGNGEAIVDQQTGFVVAPRSPHELAEKLALLVRDEALRQRLGQAAHDRARRHFSIENCVAEYAQLYDGLLLS
ncbi:MAG: glycosyltransferase [Pseudomonadota bacterium]